MGFPLSHHVASENILQICTDFELVSVISKRVSVLLDVSMLGARAELMETLWLYLE